MKCMTPGQDVSTKIKRSIHYSAEPVALWAMNILGALICAFFIGVTITEGIAGIFPKIPEPINQRMPRQKHDTDGRVSTIWSKHIVLYVRGADRQRLAQTLAHDVAVHGGTTIRKNSDNATWTFAVPQPYLKRIQQLSASSGVKPPNTAYQQWAIAVHHAPHDPSIMGPPNTEVTLRLVVPLFSNPATKPLIKWTMIPSLIALLTIPAAFLSERITAGT